MSQSNTPNATPYVKPGSVPQCLRHTMPCVPLEEAAWIAEFLGAACEALPFPLVDMFNKTDDVLWSPEPKEAAHADA